MADKPVIGVPGNSDTRRARRRQRDLEHRRHVLDLTHRWCSGIVATALATALAFTGATAAVADTTAPPPDTTTQNTEPPADDPPAPEPPATDPPAQDPPAEDPPAPEPPADDPPAESPPATTPPATTPPATTPPATTPPATTPPAPAPPAETPQARSIQPGEYPAPYVTWRVIDANGELVEAEGATFDIQGPFEGPGADDWGTVVTIVDNGPDDLDHCASRKSAAEPCASDVRALRDVCVSAEHPRRYDRACES